MRKKIADSRTAKKGKSHRPVARATAPGAAKGKHLSDADLDKVAGGAVGPCEIKRTAKV